MSVREGHPRLIRRTSTRIPTPRGEFTVHLYDGFSDDKEHMALVIGDVAGKSDVLVRVHSECFTGDVLGSLRCDCGEQLDLAMQMINEQGAGVILYLRQEGRGIGLLEKLRAYDLQDQGYDTVDANLMLGHEADARDYTVAAQMLQDLDVHSVSILTNNPLKITALRELGIDVTRRVPIQVGASPENLGYLQTKANRMNHLLEFVHNGSAHLNGHNGHTNGNGNGHHTDAGPMMTVAKRGQTRPAVTISYAQSLDGSIASRSGEQLVLSNDESMKMTHRLRASHDAILVGIGTALSDNPRLTVRLVEGRNPQAVVIDSTLRMPTDANLFSHGNGQPWIVTTDAASSERQAALEAAGARVYRVPADAEGHVDLAAMLELLGQTGIQSLMVEGGSRVISGFLAARLVDQIVLTIAPRLVGGLRVLGDHEGLERLGYPQLGNVHYQWLGSDIVLWGSPVWESP